MIDEAEYDRKGYKLTYDAQLVRDDWKDYGGCLCFISAPCGSCIHEGNPISQAEDDEC